METMSDGTPEWTLAELELIAEMDDAERALPEKVLGIMLP